MPDHATPAVSDASWRETLTGKGILITGASGYLATALLGQLATIDCRIVRLSRHALSSMSDTPRAEVVNLEGNLHDTALLARAVQDIDLVFHLAAQTSTYAANADPLQDHAANVLPMINLLEALRRRGGSPALCFASTSTIAGIPRQLPVGDEHPDHPLTVYDLHKQSAEGYLRWYVEQDIVRGASLRLTNVYGPGPRSSSADRGVMNLMIERALNGETLSVYGDGKELRDYIFINDVAQAFLAAATRIDRLAGGHFLIGSGRGHSFAEAMALISRVGHTLTGNAAKVCHVPWPHAASPIETRNFVADSSRFTELTGWHPLHSLEEGIRLTMEKRI